MSLYVDWNVELERVFRSVQKVLPEALAVALPNLSEPFSLYISERRGIALGLLIQTLRAVPRPVGYLLKNLDRIAKVWPPCLGILAALALLLKEALTFTFNQSLTIYTPHQVINILHAKAPHWLSNNSKPFGLTPWTSLLNPAICYFHSHPHPHPSTGPIHPGGAQMLNGPKPLPFCLGRPKGHPVPEP